MTGLEICLVILGIVVIVVSYLISDRVAEEHLKQKAEEIVLGSDSKEILLRQTKETVEEILDNLSDDVTDRAERELEKMSTEKIMAVHEYSETVLGEINKNHNEVMFLYSMLDDKDKEIKQTVRDVRDTLKSVQRIEQIIEEKQINQIGQNVGKEKDSEALYAEVKSGPDADEGKKTGNTQLNITPDEIQEFVTAKNTQDSNKEAIIKLHKEGYSNVEIAKMLGLGVGEVRLVLGLFRGVEK